MTWNRERAAETYFDPSAVKYTSTDAAYDRIKVIEKERDQHVKEKIVLMKPAEDINEQRNNAYEEYGVAREEMLRGLGLGWPKGSDARVPPAAFMKKVAKLIGVPDPAAFEKLRDKNASDWRDPLVLQLFNTLRLHTPDSPEVAAIWARHNLLQEKHQAKEREIKSGKAYQDLARRENDAYREIRHCRDEIERIKRNEATKASREALKTALAANADEMNVTKVRKQLRDLVKLADEKKLKWPPEEK